MLSCGNCLISERWQHAKPGHPAWDSKGNSRQHKSANALPQTPTPDAKAAEEAHSESPLTDR
jgi:hypothetical protein